MTSNTIDMDSLFLNPSPNKKKYKSVFMKQGESFARFQEKIHHPKYSARLEYAMTSPRSPLFTEGFMNIKSDSGGTLFNSDELFNSTKDALDSSIEAEYITTHMKKHATGISGDQPKFKENISASGVLQKTLSTKVQHLKNTLSSSNRLLGQNVNIADIPGDTTTTSRYYITNQGIPKKYPTTTSHGTTQATGQTMNTTSGTKSCPTSVALNYSAATDPDLDIKTGTPLKLGQPCGNEGNFVFVDSIYAFDLNPDYKGTFDVSKLDSAHWIGGAPSIPVPPSIPTAPFVLNGDFSSPSIRSGSYEYAVNGAGIDKWVSFGNNLWNPNIHGACLINNSNAWGYPTPYGVKIHPAQAVSLQAKSYLYQAMSLPAGNFTLTFDMCARPGYGGNPFTVSIANSSKIFYLNSTLIPASSIHTYWSSASYSFTMSQTDIVYLQFAGQNTTDNDTAITNVSILQTSSAAAATADAKIPDGLYTFESCKKSAMYAGFQYFGLSATDSATGYGYCVGTNDSVLTPSYIYTPVALWKSGTTGFNNYAKMDVDGNLKVLDINQNVLYQSSNPKTPYFGYIGCYGDRWSRAMNFMDGGNNGAHAYTSTQCSTFAQNNNYKYWAIQDYHASSGVGQCSVSNDLGATTKYGAASNCSATADNVIVGSGWSNGVYNTFPDNIDPVNGPFYFAMLKDNFDFVLSKGASADVASATNVLWQASTDTRKPYTPLSATADILSSIKNPSFTNAKGKNGKFYLSTGDTLHAGEWIASANGNCFLIMQTDGNLVLYKWTRKDNNVSLPNTKMIGGGVNGVALYDLGTKMTENLSTIGKMGFVDENATLWKVPSTMVDPMSGNDYTGFSNTVIISPSLASSDVTSVDQCKSICDNTAECAGFVYVRTDLNNLKCNTKTAANLLYSPTNHWQSITNTDMYIKKPGIQGQPDGISSQVIPIDANTYLQYGESGATNAGDLSTYKPQIVKDTDTTEYENSMVVSATDAGKMYTNIDHLIQEAGKATGLIQQNDGVITSFSGDITKTHEKILKTIERDIPVYQSMEEAGNLFHLQSNYQFIVWSIIAIFFVCIALYMVK